MPDSEVISLCDRLIAAQAAREASDYEDATLEPIDSAMTADFERLMNLPPITTAAGARSLAKAAVALAVRSKSGDMLSGCGGQQAEALALAVAEYLAAA